MARTNLKRVQKAIEAAAEAAISQLAKERKADADHIARHADESQGQLDKLTIEEGRLLVYIDKMRADNIKAFDSMTKGIRELFTEMRADEQNRLRSLQAHVEDIITEEQLPEPQKVVSLPKNNNSRQ